MSNTQAEARAERAWDAILLGAAIVAGIVLLAVCDTGTLRPDQFEEH